MSQTKKIQNAPDKWMCAADISRHYDIDSGRAGSLMQKLMERFITNEIATSPEKGSKAIALDMRGTLAGIYRKNTEPKKPALHFSPGFVGKLVKDNKLKPRTPSTEIADPSAKAPTEVAEELVKS